MRLFLIVFVFGLAPSTGVVPLHAQNTKENADFKLAVNLYNDGLFDLAAEQLKQFIAAYPATPQGVDARFTLGLAQLRLERFEDARLTFQTFALTYQDHAKAPEAWWNTGEAYAAVHNYREAALAFERVKVFHPKSTLAADALLRATKYFLIAGERDNARKLLRTILQEYPSSGAVSAARTQLGRMYYDEGSYDQATNELKRVIDGDPSAEAKAGALLILGDVSFATGRTDQAQAAYQEIIAKHRGSPVLQGAYLHLGRLLAAGGQHAAALEQFRRVSGGKTLPDSALLREALLGTADAQSAMNDFAAAVTTYERYLTSARADTLTPLVLWKIAASAAHARSFKKSNDACARLLKAEAPTLLKRRARIRLARNAEEQKNPQAAIQQYEAFADAFPDDTATPGVLLNVGALYAAAGDERNGAAAYEQVVMRYPSSPAADDAVAGAAQCHERTKEYDRALQLHGELVRNYPASEFRQEAEQRMRMISTFEAKSKDAGLEKLALLVGDVVAEKDRAGLAFRLGEIYFTDLKNFAAAAVQFGNALESGLAQDRAAEAMYLKARSLEYLSWKDSAALPGAVHAYRSFLAAAPVSPRADEAALALFRLSARTLTETRESAGPLLADSSVFPRKDIVRLTLARRYEEADSLQLAAAGYEQCAQITRDPAVAEEARTRKFRIFARQELVDSALAEGSDLVDAFPAGAHAAATLAQLAELAAGAQKAREAATWYERLENEFGYTQAAANARRPRADALAAAGNHDEALAAYRDLYAQEINDPAAEGEPDVALLIALGTTSRAAGNLAGAKQYLIEAIRRERTGTRAGAAFTALGFIAQGEGSRDAAASYFRQAEAAAPGVSVTRDVADLLFNSGDYADAARHYRHLATAAPNDTIRQYFDGQMIVARLRSDDVAGVGEDIAAFIKKHPESPDEQASFELERGCSHFRREEYAAALKSFQRVADKFDESPAAPAALYWTGKTLEATDKPQDATALLEKLLTTHPRDPIIPRVHLALGNLYHGAEKWNDAIRHYRIIVDDSSADASMLAPAMSNLIETYEAAGAFDGALPLARRYLELYPSSEDAFDKRIKIGILYGRLGYYDQAIVHLQSLLDEAGSDLEGEIRYYIADANYNKGDYQQAILDFLKVPYLVTKKGKIDWTANALYMSGQSYEKMARYDQALTMYQQIVDRSGIDETFRSAARKEIDRVRTVLKRKPN
jgi:TolA-binding protein